MSGIRRVLVTGGAGFVGTQLCRALAAAPGFAFRALDLPGPRLEALAPLGGETRAGNLLEPGVLEGALRDCTALIHLVVAHEHASREAHETLTLGGVRRVVEAATAAGVPRLLFLSSIKAKRDYGGLYGRHKVLAEEVIRGSGLDWTIFRPGLLYGPGELRLSRIAATLRRWPLFPMPGDGSYRIHPVRTEDLAAVLLRAIDTPAAVGRTYELGEPAGVTMGELVDMIGERIGRRRWKVRIPLGLCAVLARMLEGPGRQPLLFTDQVLAMKAGIPAPDTGPAAADLGFSTPPFAEGLDALVRTWKVEG